jgi:hypothetical protein
MVTAGFRLIADNTEFTIGDVATTIDWGNLMLSLDPPLPSSFMPHTIALPACSWTPSLDESYWWFNFNTGNRSLAIGLEDQTMRIDFDSQIEPRGFSILIANIPAMQYPPCAYFESPQGLQPWVRPTLIAFPGGTSSSCPWGQLVTHLYNPVAEPARLAGVLTLAGGAIVIGTQAIIN